MYHKEAIQQLIQYVDTLAGIGDKNRIATLVQEKFHLFRKRSVFEGPDFAIRFCRGENLPFSNTVLSLATLRKYDRKPFFVCLVTPAKNYLLLSNSSFLQKVSHSSQKLSVTCVRGSFNGGDIMRQWQGIANIPANFESLFSAHQKVSFEENLARLVIATKQIVPTGKQFMPTASERVCILNAVQRADSFCRSSAYLTLKQDLDSRVTAVQNYLLQASQIENINLRGRVIEFLITASKEQKEELIRCLHNKASLPKIFTADSLGDYGRVFEDYITATDIKTKMLFLSSAPKGYNVDKLLQFLSRPKTVYLIYVVAIDAQSHIQTQLCSIFHTQLLAGTHVIKHWAGRNSRGVTQYDGQALEHIISHFHPEMDIEKGKSFLEQCLANE